VVDRATNACLCCGASLASKRADARHCSEKCRNKSYYQETKEAQNAHSRAWAQANPEKVRATKRRSAERHPDNDKKRYARLKANPERRAAQQARQHKHYEEHREEYLKRAKSVQERFPTRGYSYRHGCNWDDLIAELWEAQDGMCYLCEEALNPDKNLAVHLDHDHRCCGTNRSCPKCRRGLACMRCNNLIGRVHDDPDFLRRIADNLEVARTLVQERMKEADLIERGVLFDLDESA